VEPKARGRGLGAALIAECVRFARQAGYQKITLWTHANLEAARRLYQRAGFRCVQSETAAEGFGRDLVDETWELDLSAGPAE
jgi:ribosomal protein S18 acetylase RimI-like enzyme